MSGAGSVVWTVGWTVVWIGTIAWARTLACTGIRTIPGAAVAWTIWRRLFRACIGSGVGLVVLAGDRPSVARSRARTGFRTGGEARVQTRGRVRGRGGRGRFCSVV